MFRTENFENYIAKARRYPEIWRLILACLFGFVVFLAGTMAIVEILRRLLDVQNAYSYDLVTALERGETPVHMAIVLATFIPMALGAIAMALFHKRGLADLLGTRHRFVELFIKCAGIIVATTGIYFAVSLMVGGPDLIAHLSVSEWLSYLPWALPLLFIQITAEELVFRGYLQQQLAARFKGFFWWMILPSLVFAIGHYNSDIDPILAVMIVFATLLFGVIAADLTRITGNLAAAMGLHFANNFFSLLVIGVPGQLSGIALFHTPFDMENVSRTSSFLALDIGILILIWIIARRVVR